MRLIAVLIDGPKRGREIALVTQHAVEVLGIPDNEIPPPIDLGAPLPGERVRRVSYWYARSHRPHGYKVYVHLYILDPADEDLLRARSIAWLHLTSRASRAFRRPDLRSERRGSGEEDGSLEVSHGPSGLELRRGEMRQCAFFRVGGEDLASAIPLDFDLEGVGVIVSIVFPWSSALARRIAVE